MRRRPPIHRHRFENLGRSQVAVGERGDLRQPIAVYREIAGDLQAPGFSIDLREGIDALTPLPSQGRD